MENIVGIGVHRRIGRFDNDRRLDLVGVFRGEHPAQGRRNQHVDVELQQLFVGQMFGLFVAGQRPAISQSIAQHAGQVESARPIVAAAHVADGDDLALGVTEKFGRVRTDIAEPLNGDARLRRLATQPAERLERDRADTAARCFFAPGRPYISTGLPVTTAGLKPWYLLYWFMIQAMTLSLVPISGAGMSVSGPITS